MKTLIKLILITLASPHFLQASIEKIDDNLYVAKKGDIYFALERVTPETFQFWKQYADHQYYLASQLDTITEKQLRKEERNYRSALETYEKEYEQRRKEYNPLEEEALESLKEDYETSFLFGKNKTEQEKLSQSIKIMEDTLSQEYSKIEPYNPSQDDTQLRAAEKNHAQAQALMGSITAFQQLLAAYKNYEVWVAYATPLNITAESHKLNLKTEGDIKMAFTVTTTPDLPFFSHMGIFRAVDDVEFKNKNLSAMILHSFAAQAIQSAYNNKKYMITKPLDIMRTIMAKSLPSGALWTSKEHPIEFSYPNMIITTPNQEKITFKKPGFFTKLFTDTTLYPIVIVDMDELAKFATFE